MERRARYADGSRRQIGRVPERVPVSNRIAAAVQTRKQRKCRRDEWHVHRRIVERAAIVFHRAVGEYRQGEQR